MSCAILAREVRVYWQHPVTLETILVAAKLFELAKPGVVDRVNKWAYGVIKDRFSEMPKDWGPMLFVDT